jgi:ADP-ribosylglycohydrolase
MSENLRAAVLGSLIGDALALGVHWDYDPMHIEQVHGRVNTFLDPAPGSYHSGKSAGDFTHYGDQTLVLLESVAQEGGFDLQAFNQSWRGLFDNYKGYVDNATRQTLKNLANGSGPHDCGSPSDDLAGAARIAPLFTVLAASPEELTGAARAQTAMTHNDPIVLDTAGFLCRLALMVSRGGSPANAILEALEPYEGKRIEELVREGLATRDMKTTTALTRLGLNCHINSALPGVVHVISKYPDDLPTCLVECVMAGGDSAARAMTVGMVMGAALGMEAIPQVWLDGLNQKDRIMQSLDKISS